MPQFTQWNVPDPFPNILYNPAAVDAAIAKTQSELGNLDINRRELALKQDAATRDLAFGDYLKQSLPTDGTTGATGAGAGAGGAYAPGTLPETPQLATVTAPGGAKFQVAATAAERFQGLVTDLEAEGYKLDPATSGGYNKRFIAGTQTPSHHAYGTAVDVNWSRNPQGGTSSDIPVDLARRLAAKHGLVWGGDWSGKTRDPMHFEVPRGASASAPPVVAAPVVAAPAANPNAGPRVGAAPTVPTVAPAIAPSADPNTRVEADDPNTAAVKQPSAALLQMPEADAAAAYPGVVRELQARGFAMNAPPTYPGHAALQALVGGGDATTPDVAQTKTAMRLGGTDVAGPPGVVPTPPDVQPNRMAYGTGLPGVTIGMPTNGMAPPVQTAAAPAQAQPQAASPQPQQPPPAPSRVIQREPLIQSGIFAGLTRTQAATIANTPGVKPAQIMDQIATARHQNDVIRQGDATQAAIDEEKRYNRGRQSQQDQTAADKAVQDAADKKEAQRLAAAGNEREAAKAHDLTLDEIAPKMDDGTATPAEKRRYARSYYAKQQEGATATEMTTADGLKIPVLITRRLPKQYPEPEGGALPLVVKSPDAPTKGPTPDSEAKAAGYADRMQIAVQAMERLDDTSTYVQRGLEQAGKYTGYSINSSEYELLRTAQRAFLGAILKRESGAEVKDSEFERDSKIYFPQPGEGIEVARFKQRLRQAAMEATIRAAGDGYKPASSVAAPTTSTTAPIAAPTNPAERKADTTYQTPKGPLKWTGTGWVAP